METKTVSWFSSTCVSIFGPLHGLCFFAKSYYIAILKNAAEFRTFYKKCKNLFKILVFCGKILQNQRVSDRK